MTSAEAGGPTTVWPAPRVPLVLRAEEIHIFSFAADLPPSRIGEIEPLLSPAELARADRFRFARDRGRYIVARGQLRTILGRYTNRAAVQLEFGCGPFGKPTLRAGSGDDRIRFNLSHSDGLGLVAIRLDEDLGIDVERIRPFDDALAIAKRLFAAEEYGALRSLPQAEQLPSFFRYWTRKEAVVKSIGRGLAYPLGGFALSLDPRAGVERLAIDCDGRPATRWVLPVSAPRDGFVAAVATAGSPAPVRCWAWVDG